MLKKDWEAAMLLVPVFDDNPDQFRFLKVWAKVGHDAPKNNNGTTLDVVIVINSHDIVKLGKITFHSCKLYHP